jgi:hypothetical protein
VQLDWFHWNLSVGWFFVMIELIAGTCPHDPPIRVLAIPAATMLFAIGVELLLVDALRIAGIRAPCRISSLPVGAPLRPGIYAYIEDICAVDGSGGTEFRQRLNLRYQASKAFREMLHRLTLFWAIGAIVCSVVTVAIVFTIQRDAAYIVSRMRPVTYSNANSPRSAGFYLFSGLVYGPPLPFLGCRRAWLTSTTSGQKPGSRPRSFLFPFALRPDILLL